MSVERKKAMLAEKKHLLLVVFVKESRWWVCGREYLCVGKRERDVVHVRLCVLGEGGGGVV